MAVRDTASLLAGLLLVLLHTWGALAAVEVNMKDKVEVNLRETARITCMYTSEEGSGSMEIQWFYLQTGNRHRIYSQDSMTKTVDKNTPYSNRISVNDTLTPGEVVLSISDVKLEDEVVFICHVKSLSEDSGEGQTKLKVFAKPDLPTIEGVTTGVSVTSYSPSKIATCEVKNGFPKPNLVWYKNKVPMKNTPDVVKVKSSTTTESSGLLSVRSELSMTVTKEDKDAKFYCEATYLVPGGDRMTETKEINITVIYPSTSVDFWVESPRGKIKEGDTVELHCRGDGNFPSTVSINNIKNVRSWDGGVAVLENVTRLDTGEYDCTVTDTENFDEISNQTSVFVNYLDPAVLNPSDTVLMDQGDEIKATCNALSSLHTSTTWLKNGVKVSKDHSLILKDAKFNTAGTYVCVVTVPEIEGMETSSSLRVHVRGRPEIQEKGVTEMETYEKTIDLSCHVSGYPTPKITWSTSDGKAIHSVSQMETDVGAKSLLTVQVTSDVTVFCNASNEHGTDGATFIIKAKTTIHTTIPVTTTTATTATTTTTTSTIPKATEAIQEATSTTVKTGPSNPSKEIKKESNGVIIAVIIICILLLAILGSVLYFLYKKGKICNRSGKQDITKEKSSKDNIVVEMKSDNTEEAILLGVNGEKQPPGDQDGEYLHVQA